MKNHLIKSPEYSYRQECFDKANSIFNPYLSEPFSHVGRACGQEPGE